MEFAIHLFILGAFAGGGVNGKSRKPVNTLESDFWDLRESPRVRAGCCLEVATGAQEGCLGVRFWLQPWAGPQERRRTSGWPGRVGVCQEPLQAPAMC